MKFSIWYGAPSPIVAVGKHQCRLLQFAERFRGWHTFSGDRTTVRAVSALARKGCLEISGDQFRFVYPGRA